MCRYNLGMDKFFTDNTGKRVKAMREHRGLTQIELADAVSATGAALGNAYLSQIERQNKTPSVATIIALAKALDTSTDYLLMLTDEPEMQNAPREMPGISEQAEEAARIIDGLQINAHRQYCLDMIRLFVGLGGASEKEVVDELQRVATDVGTDEAHLVAQHILNRQPLPDAASLLDASTKRQRTQPSAPVN